MREETTQNSFGEDVHTLCAIKYVPKHKQAVQSILMLNQVDINKIYFTTFELQRHKDAVF